MKPPVKDRIRQGRIPQRLMPVRHRDLPGDESRAAPVPVVQAFEHVAAVRSIQGGQSPGSEAPEGRCGPRGHARGRAAVALGHGACLAQARHPERPDGLPGAARRVAHGARQPGCAVLMTMPFSG
jgi:hypothetical protein